MQTTIKFIKYDDPGHGWLAVPTAYLQKIGLALKDFSKYSYRSRDGSMVYLEEDCDAGKFVQVLEQKDIPFDITYNNSNYDSFVRSLPRIY